MNTSPVRTLLLSAVTLALSGGLAGGFAVRAGAQPAASSTTIAATTIVPTTIGGEIVVATTAPPTTAVATTAASPTTVVPSTVVAPPSTSVVPSGPADVTPPSTVSSVVPSTLVVGPPAPTTTTTVLLPAFAPGKSLGLRSKGDAVLALEQRLDGLRYDVGPVDGKFDWQTWQGVVAFQKVNGLKRTGNATPEVQVLIANSPEPGSLLPHGGSDRIEIDIGRQVMMIFRQNALWKVVAVSSGSGRKYCETSQLTQKQNCGEATTPRGNFKIQRRIPGWHESDLGKLYNPLYFNGGFAIHGALSVPAGPASHGCVRIPMGVAEWFPDEIRNGTPVYIFD